MPMDPKMAAELSSDPGVERVVLGSAAVRERVQWALIDRNARKGKSPSDHAPLVVELAE